MKQITRRILNVAFLARSDEESAEFQAQQAAQTERSAITPLSLDELKNVVGGDTGSPKGSW